METNNQQIRRVLVFNPQKKLIAIFQSAFAVAKALNWNVSSVRGACSGKIISYQKLYFRYLADNIELEGDDLGKLNLGEYDDLCQVKRKTYANGKMSRKGMKYKKRPKEKSEFYPYKENPNKNESQHC